MNMHVSHTCDREILHQEMAEYQLLETDDGWQLLSVAHRAPCPVLTAAHHILPPHHLCHLHPKKGLSLLASLPGQSAPEVECIKMSL